MDFITTAMAGVLLLFGIWNFLRRVVVKSEPDDKTRDEAKKALGMIAFSMVIVIAGHFLDPEELLQEAVIMSGILGMVTITGLFFNVWKVPPKPVTQKDIRLSRITTAMITCIVWVGIPYLGFVVLPETGIEPFIAVGIATLLAWASPLIDIL